MRIKLVVSYDGTMYNGFQLQKDKITVQGELQSALKKLYSSDIIVYSSGRTDKGVHAYNQVMHYDTEKDIDPVKIVSALKFYLPQDIRAVSATVVDDSFNARVSAKSKTYFYDIYFSDIESPFLENRALRVDKKFYDTEKIKSVLDVFIGRHDFTNFRAIGSSAKTTVRKVIGLELEETELYCNKAIRLKITADGFLYKMVRIIVGSILRVVTGVITKNDLINALNNPHQEFKKVTAPPHGLYLANVTY